MKIDLESTICSLLKPFLKVKCIKKFSMKNSNTKNPLSWKRSQHFSKDIKLPENSHLDPVCKSRWTTLSAPSGSETFQIKPERRLSLSSCLDSTRAAEGCIEPGADTACHTPSRHPLPSAASSLCEFSPPVGKARGPLRVLCWCSLSSSLSRPLSSSVAQTGTSAATIGPRLRVFSVPLAQS